jgi:uncharacterized membrane protein
MLGSWEPRLAATALLLTAINVIAVNLAAVATFAAKGIKPRRYWETRNASTMTRVALAIWIALLLVLAGLVWLARDGGVAL